MEIKGINHLLFSVSDLLTSIEFYQNVFDAKLLAKGRSTAYFDLNGIWLALNEERDIPRNDIKASYTHIAFTIEESKFEEMSAKLKNLQVTILPGENEMNVIENQFISPILTAINLNSIQELFKTDFNIISKLKPIWIFLIEKVRETEQQRIYIFIFWG